MINYFIPEGVSDLNYDEYEKICTIENSLLAVFKKEGYRQIRTPAFEYFDLFAESDNSMNTQDMYKLIDSSGKLMVLRPDATLPIARMIATQYKDTDGDVKLTYLTEVFRSADFRAGEKREFKQAGIEYFGTSSPKIDSEIIMTAVHALNNTEFRELKTELGDTRYFNGFTEALRAYDGFDSNELMNELKELVEMKNIPGLFEFTKKYNMPDELSEVLLKIPLLYGDIDKVLDKAYTLSLNEQMRSSVENLRNIRNYLDKDFSLSADMGLVNRLEYYSGMLFKIYLKDTGVIVGSGGRYDKLMSRFGKNISAAGFGLNIDTLYESLQNANSNYNCITIALGKGRLADITIEKLAASGIIFPEYNKQSRKLIFDDSTGHFRIIFVKAVDVGIYVEKGACDIGIIGKDTLLESGSDVFEILDLGYGKCSFAIAAPEGFRYDTGKKLTVATKYPNIATSYFARFGRSIEIIKINGSVELAPLVGLSDVIADIVETGTTLRENGLTVVEKIADISARLIVNRAALKTKETAVSEIIDTMKKTVDN